jgi:FSR family fosmidomycin resistance protein-like MFS transporter
MLLFEVRRGSLMDVPFRLTPARPAASAAHLAALLTLSHSAVDAVAGMPAALLPTLQQRFGLTEIGLALLVATLSFSSSVTQPFFGALADRLSARWVVIGGSILTSVVLSLIGVAPSAVALVLLFLIGGFGSAAYHPAGASLARGTGVTHPSLVVSLFGAGGTVGLALGPILVISVIATYGLGATPWLMLPGLLLAALLALTAPPSARPVVARRSALQGLYSLPRQVWLLALVGIFESIAFITFMNGMPLWLVAQGVASESSLIGWTLAAFALAAAGGSIIASALVRRVPAFALVGGTMLLALLPLFSVFTRTPGAPLYFVAVMLAGGLMHAGFPLLIVRAQDLAPDAIATASGMLMGFATGVAGLVYIGVGYLQELLGIAAAMQLAFLALVPAALLAGAIVGPALGALSEDKDDVSSCRCSVCRCAAYAAVPART